MMSEKRCMILCSVTEVKDSQVVYPCCPKCCSKLRCDCFQDRWQCMKCGFNTSAGEMDWRFRVSFVVTDGQLQVNICLFGSVLQQYFGLPPNQFVGFLRRVEKTHCNSEDVVLQALRQCFVGNYYYFGVKTSNFPFNTRPNLHHIVPQKRSACQNALLSQEDSPSTIAFQMVPAVNRETYTVYEIIQNYFQPPSDISLCREQENKQDIRDSFSRWSNTRLEWSHLSSRSGINGSYSHISLGQTTALLSCDETDLSTTTNSTYNQSKDQFKCCLSENRGKQTGSSTYVLESEKSPSILKLGDKMKTYFVEQEKGSINADLMPAYRDNMDMYANTESLFSEDYCVGSPHRSAEIFKDVCSQQCYFGSPELLKDPCSDSVSPELLKDQCSHSGSPELLRDGSSQRSDGDKQMVSQYNVTATSCNNSHSRTTDFCDTVSLEGTLLLEKLKLPEMDGNIPDSEELELYLMNDSSFDLSVDKSCSNGDQKSSATIQKCMSTNKIVSIKQSSLRTPDMECHNGQLVHKGNFNGLKETTRNETDKICMSTKPPVVKDALSKQSEVSSIVELGDHLIDEIISCAPELGTSHVDDLCDMFNGSLRTNAPNKEVSCHDNTGNNKLTSKDDELHNGTCLNENLNPQTTVDCQHSDNENDYNEHVISKAVDKSDMVMESQSSVSSNVANNSKIIEDGECESLGVRPHSIVSESYCFNHSEDLFGCSVDGSVHRSSNESRGCSIVTVDDNESDNKKKSVRFSRRLSFQKTVQLIDLQMKMKSNVCTAQTKMELNKKSCLKSGMEVIVENQCNTEHEVQTSGIMTGTVNSPIYSQHSVLFSQDLFSPSPDICLKSKSHNVFTNLKGVCTSKADDKVDSSSQHRHSSTPIENGSLHTEDFNSDSLLSIFNDSFDGEHYKENFSPDSQHSRHSHTGESNSRRLFSQSCSLFSNSCTKENNSSTRGDNSSCLSDTTHLQKGSNINSLTNYSCDLFSPSFSGREQSPLLSLPVKRLFLDKH